MEAFSVPAMSELRWPEEVIKCRWAVGSLVGSARPTINYTRALLWDISRPVQAIRTTLTTEGSDEWFHAASFRLQARAPPSCEVNEQPREPNLEVY